MIEVYEVDGRKYRVSQDKLQKFLNDFPNAVKVGKAQGSTEDPTMSQKSMGSQLDDGSSESVSWFDQTWFGRGVKAASTTGEATDLMSQDFSNIDIKSIQDFIIAKEEEARSYQESERMKKFQEQYKKEGSTWSAFFRGVRKQPGLLPELFVQSLGTQLGTLIDSPGASLAAVGTGAAGGAAVGAIPGALAGAFGGLATSMEAALTFGELIETRLKEKNLEFTDENIKKLLEEEGTSIRNKAIGRGLTIGTIEGLSGGLAGKAALATKSAVGATRGIKTATLAAGAAGTTVEAAGGAVGEIAGRAVAGQEMDAAEIGFEAITGTVTAPVNVSAALLTAKKPTYTLNGEDITYEQMKDFVDTADDIDIAKADIKMRDEYTGIGKKAKARQEAAEQMLKLSEDEATLAEVKEAKEKNIAEADYKANMAFAKKHVDLYGLKFTELTKEEIAERFGKDSDLINALGTVSGDEIIINKDNAKTQEYGDNVGNHELLHGIIKASGANISEQTISEFRGIIGEEANAAIQKRIDTTVDKNGKKVYDKEYLSKHRDEYFTMFSDAIEAGEIKFNDSIFTKIRDLFRRMFASLGVSKVNFNDAQSTYNFLKDYNRSIHKGALSSGLKSATKGTAFFETMDKKSVSVERRNQISSSVQELGNTFAFEGGKKLWDEAGADQAITAIKEGKFLDDLIASKYKADKVPVDFVDKVYSELTSHIKNFNPETNDNLFGWINSQLANKAGNVFNREYKQVEQEKTARDVDDRTKEGEVKVQVAAEKDIAMQEFEEQDISIAAEVKRRKEQQDKKPEYSKFRRKLGIETGGEIYNRVLDATRKALIRAYETGKPARNIQRNLRDEANTYLFKTIKNFLGTNTYISNLKNFRESIVETMFTADLVQMEREVADDQKIFVKFEKLLTSKKEVQDAINKNLLPSSALNTIDKGQAVSLYKKVMPTKEKFIAFFDQPAINPKTGKRSGLKGTRKDQLSKYMSGALAYDATMQVAQEADVIQKRQDIADLRGQEIPTNDLQVLSEVINRPINVKFSVGKPKFKNSLNTEVLNLNKEGLSFESQFMFLETALRNFNLGPEKALELAFIKLSEQTINPADKAYLAKIIKEGIVDEAYIKNVLKQIKAVTVKEIKQYGYNATVNRLNDKVKQASTKEQKVKIIKEFLINESKSIRTSKADNITRNRQVYDNILSPLLDKYNITGFSVVELKTKDGKKTRTFKDKDGNNIPYTKIAFEGETLNTYAKVTDIKRNFANFIETINTESKQAIDYIIDIVEDTNLSNLEKKAIIKLLTTDQVGAFRKISKAGMYVEGLLTKETTLDHEVTINDLYQKTIATINGEINASDLRSIFNNSRVNLIPKTIDNILNEQKLKSTGADRMHNKKVKTAVDKVDFKDKSKVYGNNEEKAGTAQSKAKIKARTPMSYSKKSRGMSTFDFDETLIDKGENFIIAKKGKETIKISSSDWPILGSALAEQGYEFDFTDFVNVRGGVEGPLLQKMRNQIKKFGPSNVFVLTARPPQSAEAIHAWLKSKDINIPLKNITGLGNSTGEAKAVWMLEKFAEGYNDMYFVDDALPNVKAVKNALEQLDIKSKVRQAKSKFSKGTLSTKQDLNWKEDNIGYMTTNFDVDGNNYKITLYPTDLNDTNYELEFDLVTEYGLTQEMTGTGSQFKVLGIVYNGLLDVIKQKPNIETIGFSSLTKDKSRARVYTILMDRLGKKLGWKTDIYEYGSGTQLDFEVAKPKTRKAKTKTTESIRNIPAVKNMLNQFDVKAPTQQAKLNFSSSMDKQFNDVLQDVTSIDSKKRYLQAKARKRGEGKGRFRFFIPPSHEDFVGILYNFIGKGEAGNKHRNFFEKALIKPLNRSYRRLNAAKQAIANDYKALMKENPEIRKQLIKETPDGDFVFSDAVRVYLFDKAGFEIPGLSKTDKTSLINLIKEDIELKSFADKIGIISKQKDGYIEPGEHWQTGDIRTDLADATGRVGRKQFFTEFIENSEIIFGKMVNGKLTGDNINKIEAAFGVDFREALQDILHRTITGTNRTVGPNKLVNRFLDYLNGSVGATMFFNARSAVLQTLSTVNFINFGDNNIFNAATAFANQKQFWQDFSMIFNSDFLKQRRAGVAFDVNASEIASAVSKSKQPVRAAISHLLQIGFLPTQIADSFAIALGGSSMYRNRISTYIKQGLSQEEAQSKAFIDFQEIAEATQQSARPDMVSQQQASPLGRMILAFQNVTSQYARLIKKAGLDLINRRKTPPYTSQARSDMSNISRIIYYGAVQNIIFYGLQTALFAMLFEDEEKDEEFFAKKRDRVINGSIDSILRGMGVGGAIVSTIKNTAIKWAENQGKSWGKEDNVVMMEMLQLSPPVGIKARKLSSAEKTLAYNEKVIKEMETFDIDNPVWDAVGNIVEATTNIPMARLHRKTMNLREAANAENEWWQRLAVSLGWSRWDVGIENREVEDVKKKIKTRIK